uniref:cysteine desulfurase n=1 Tax=Magnetococcus massalia (strain MO-1) TaxID=451514 RepID=A0A1S7LC08_MAGMO|nr:Cysteine desulfurase (Nitrogenase metalloclusters biosynthesis protein nifS) [Candidatus Magnetococcus massalia]
MQGCYLDYNATSPMPQAVVEAMLPYFAEKAGNPASVHGAGRAARDGLEQARRQIAAMVGVHFSQVIFTSGGTEANNLALLGLVPQGDKPGHLIISAIEHPSVLRVAEALEARGITVSRISPDSQGVVQAEKVAAEITSETFLVSIMAVNNETGVVQPLSDIADLCAERQVAFHSDAIQWMGRRPLDMEQIPVKLLSLSGHKFGGPKGVGALVVDRALAPHPQLLGGGQERGRRSGTENLAGIVGMGAAAQWASDHMDEEQSRLAALRNQLEQQVLQALPQTVVIGQGADRLANTSLMGFPGLDGETLVMNLDLAGFAVSSGSACSSGRTEASHVLRAMGVDDSVARGAIRFSLGWQTREADIERLGHNVVQTIRRLQAMAGVG